MAVDSFIKRMSATNLVLPSYAGVLSVGAVLNLAQRMSASWIYAGIVPAVTQDFLINLFKANSLTFTFTADALTFTFVSCTTVFTFTADKSLGFDFIANTLAFTFTAHDRLN